MEIGYSMTDIGPPSRGANPYVVVLVRDGKRVATKPIGADDTAAAVKFARWWWRDAVNPNDYAIVIWEFDSGQWGGGFKTWPLTVSTCMDCGKECYRTADRCRACVRKKRKATA